MVRSLVFGNNNMLVCLDKDAQVRDFYYPYVGEENHVVGNKNKIGIWVDGNFSWLFHRDEWKKDLRYKDESLVGDTTAINKNLGVELILNDTVHHEKNIFLRKITVKNLVNQEREIRVFLNQHFHISGANIGNTVYYNPYIKALITYRGKRYFLINGLADKKGFSDFATGVADAEGKQGTYIDAEDGSLSKNPIEHGSVDSTISFNVKVAANSKKTIHYWIAVGERYDDVCKLNDFVLGKNPDVLINETEEYWKKWVNKQDFNFYGLSKKASDLFKRSLLIIKTQTDKHGAIIAANDSDTLYLKKDTYSYMWPRDGALVARSLDKAGYKDMTKKFFEFCRNVLTDEGYLFHKYLPDESLGSSWHPWLNYGHAQLPIQEDQTALVIDALWKKYLQYGDTKFVKDMYCPLVKKAADFMVSYRDKKTKLPKESYDLWEEKLGITTFTSSTVYAGLIAASKLASVFGTEADFARYKQAAEEIKQAILEYLYDKEENRFIKGVYWDEKGDLVKDKTVDSSTFYGLFEYGILDLDDERLKRTIEVSKDRLSNKTEVGGLIRYEYDNYYKTSDNAPSNPWFITTLWLAQYYIDSAKSEEDLKPAVEIFEWAANKAQASGILSEQIHPYTGEQLSVAPLTWSHGTYVTTMIKYLDKLDKLGLCDPYMCYPLRMEKGKLSIKK